ncbi:MAG: sensor histidine kinase [Pseudomonadota bacterium]
MKLQSLRSRLTLIILAPLLLVAIAAAFWQFRNTTAAAQDIFDRGLLSAALAISRDVALSDGDALSPATRGLVSSTSGGDLFYHVYAPDGVFVTGYATPPAPPAGTPFTTPEPLYYNAVYQSRDVRVLRFQDAATVDGVSGIFTISVWQNMSFREAFTREMLTRTFIVIAMLLVSVALIVWFGVGLGLRPLLDLKDAIAKRTPSELEPIRRNVPVEAQPIVSTLNALLDRVSRRISSKDEFISSAAHQLRNPIAGVLALAEAVETAPTPEAAKSRSAELVAAARDATHLTNQLLSFERARGSDIDPDGARIDLAALLEDTLHRFTPRATNAQIEVTKALPDHPVWIIGDKLMLGEAILNILTNAAVHGGTALSKISVSLTRKDKEAVLRIQDDGIGIAPEDRPLALGRFSQANTGPGSGLGLPIAARVVDNHDGALTIEDSNAGTSVLITLPLSGRTAQSPS